MCVNAAAGPLPGLSRSPARSLARALHRSSALRSFVRSFVPPARLYPLASRSVRARTRNEVVEIRRVRCEVAWLSGDEGADVAWKHVYPSPFTSPCRAINLSQ